MATPGTLLRRLVVVLGVLALLSRPASAPAAEADPVGGWPLRPAPDVVRGFDAPDSPWGAGHRGVDLLGVAGQPVRAALPGRVAYAGALAGRGVVVVDHGSTRTTYEPVAPSVSPGDRVAVGDRLGRLAVVGSHCLPRACLHWGWIAGETYLDPLRLVGAGPVRLLPLWRDDPVTGPSTTPTPARLTSSGRAPSWRAPALPYDGWRPPIRLVLPSLNPFP